MVGLVEMEARRAAVILRRGVARLATCRLVAGKGLVGRAHRFQPRQHLPVAVPIVCAPNLGQHLQHVEEDEEAVDAVRGDRQADYVHGDGGRREEDVQLQQGRAAHRGADEPKHRDSAADVRLRGGGEQRQAERGDGAEVEPRIAVGWERQARRHMHSDALEAECRTGRSSNTAAGATRTSECKKRMSSAGGRCYSCQLYLPCC
mmetsp:Transcript_36060/g.93651  ORF Transcript_36060/g.93651 Transcript_36060/m.93651 type:complete len:204 (+) Transcript_36060:231-842(+)